LPRRYHEGEGQVVSVGEAEFLRSLGGAAIGAPKTSLLARGTKAAG